MSSRFDCVQCAPPVAIFALAKAYREDTNPNKVDLGIGGIWFFFLNSIKFYKNLK